MAFHPSTTVAAFLLLALSGCHLSETNSESSSTELPLEPLTFSAELEQVSQCSWPIVVRAQGSLMADELAVIGAKVAGRVAATEVDLGSKVAENDVLATLELTEFDLRVQQAEAQLAEACATVGLQSGDSLDRLERDKVPSVMVAKAILDEAVEALGRAKQLQTSRAVSRSEYDKQVSAERVADAQYQSALRSVDEQIALIGVRRAALAMARQDREDAVIRAPFEGVVQKRHVAAGVIVQAGTPLVTLVRNNPLRFRGRVPELKSNSVRVGQPLRIFVAGVPEAIQSVVKRTSPSLDESNRSLMIEGDLDNAGGQLRSGVFAEADIVVDSDATTVAVPTSAVGEFAGVHRVWLVTDGIAAQKQVEVGRRSDDQMEIVTGLAPNQWIVVHFDKGLAGRIETPVANQLTSAQP